MEQDIWTGDESWTLVRDASAPEFEFEDAAKRASILCLECARGLRELNFLDVTQPAAERANFFRARQLVRDCIELCDSTARLSSKGSPLTGSIAQACEDCCRECASSRKWLQTERPEDWLEACRRAAAACHDLARQSHGWMEVAPGRMKPSGVDSTSWAGH